MHQAVKTEKFNCLLSTILFHGQMSESFISDSCATTFGKYLSLSLQKKATLIFHICNLGTENIIHSLQPLVLNVSDAPQSLFSWIVVWYIYTQKRGKEG